MKTNLLLWLFFSSICFRALAQCDCPATPTNIQYVPGFNSGAPLQLDLNSSHQDDIAWDVAPVDANGDGITDWLVVVGSTVIQSTHGTDAFARQVFLDGSTGWYYHVDFTNHKDEEAHAVFVTSDPSPYILLCGTARTTFKHPTNTYLSDDVWVQKLSLTGNPDLTWSSTGLGKFYGSYATSTSVKNPDKGYDIAVDNDGNYVVVGQGWAKNVGDITDDVQGNGDVWVLKLDPSNGTLLDNAIWFSIFNSSGTDHAESVAVDCNTGHYIVSGFCGSCDYVMPPLKVSDAILLDFDPSNLHASGYPHKYPYGTSGRDQNSFDLIQSFDNTFGTCTSGDGFVSNGIIHECINGSHNLYGIKTQSNLSPSTFIVNCTGNDGVARGGIQEDDGYSVIQAPDGYLLAGATYSNALADGSGEVSCNHYDYDCTETDAATSDFWLAHINRCTGELDWDESIGTSSNDICYSIKRLSDDSYVMVGYTRNTTGADADLYIVTLTITQCNAPVNLTASNTGFTLDFDWDGSKCNPYHFQYKRNNGAYGNDMYLTTSEAHPAVTQCGIYTGRVQTKCSSTLASSWVYATVTISSGCKIGMDEIPVIGILSVSPNPSGGEVEISLQRSDLFNGLAAIELFDNTGRIIKTDKKEVVNGSFQLSKSLDIPAGFYLVKAKVDGITNQAKLLIQKN